MLICDVPVAVAVVVALSSLMIYEWDENANNSNYDWLKKEKWSCCTCGTLSGTQAHSPKQEREKKPNRFMMTATWAYNIIYLAFTFYLYFETVRISVIVG